MKLSIIIPVYNVEKYIDKCLLSCINQKGVSNQDYEIIIVNDGTKDNSMIIIDEIIKSQNSVHNITIITQKNMGLSIARNTGLRHAKGEYVWFVDSDDWIDEDSIESILSELNISDVDILQMPYKLIYENNNSEEIESIIHIKEPIPGRECMKITRFPNAAVSRIYNRNFLNNNNLHFIQGIFHEDAEFKPRVLWQAKRVKTLNKPCYNYLKRTGNSITASFTIRNAEGRWCGVKSMYEFSKEFSLRDKLIFNNDMNFNMFFIITGLKKLNNKDKCQMISTMSKSRKIFKRLMWTLSPKKFIIYLMLYTAPRFVLNLYRR